MQVAAELLWLCLCERIVQGAQLEPGHKVLGDCRCCSPPCASSVFGPGMDAVCSVDFCRAAVPGADLAGQVGDPQVVPPASSASNK
jgi:hypothetical protein